MQRQSQNLRIIVNYKTDNALKVKRSDIIFVYLLYYAIIDNNDLQLSSSPSDPFGNHKDLSTAVIKIYNSERI